MLNDVVVKSEANIFPQLIFMQKKRSLRIVDGAVAIGVFAEQDNRASAEQFRQEIFRQMEGKSLPVPLRVNIYIYGEKISDDLASAILLPSKDSIQFYAEAFARKGVLTFGVDEIELISGAMLTIRYGARVLIVANKDAIKTAGILFKDDFYSIVQVVKTDKYKSVN